MQIEAENLLKKVGLYMGNKNKKDNGISNQNLEELYKEACSHYEKKEYEEALNKINRILKIEKSNVQARSAKAAILIESWNGNDDTKIHIMEAIDHLNILIERDSLKKDTLFENKGRAFYRLAVNELIKRSGKLNPHIIDNLEKAKNLFQKSLEINEEQPKVWIDKGNTLDYLGRYLEAIECFDKAILLDSKHYNAWGNRGLTCLRLSQIIDHEDDRAKLFAEAMIYLAIELNMYPDFNIEDNFKKSVENFIQENGIQIDLEDLLIKQLPRKRSLLGESFNYDSYPEIEFEPFYYNFCEKYSLFLNLHFDCNKCGISTRDLINVGFVTTINDNKKPYELFKRWFNIEDDYKTSRCLLTIAHFRDKSFLFLNKERYEPDYSLNYIFNVELLKTAFSLAMNIYDKVAFFLNEYEEMGLEDDSISFWASNSIFNKTNILEKNKWQIDIVALDSIRKSLEKQEFKKLVEIRRYITHRYFVLHDIINIENLTYPYDSSNTPLENKEYHLDINEFFNLTIKVLQNVRNILFSLAFFISQKEKLKEKQVKGKIGRLYWTYEWEKDESAKNDGNEYK